MLTHFHSSIGAIIVICFKDNPALGLFLAMLSHIPCDLIQEKYLKKNFKQIEIAFLLLFAITCYLFSSWLMFIGGISANILDIIDKPLYYYTKKRFMHFSWYNIVKIPNYKICYAIGILVFIIMIIFAIFLI